MSKEGTAEEAAGEWSAICRQQFLTEDESTEAQKLGLDKIKNQRL